MFKLNKKKEEPAVPEPQEAAAKPIVLGVILDDELVDVFAVSNPRVASLFLHNPTFVDMSEYKTKEK